ncbi:MAG: ATP-dependent DNA helicase [Atopobiaceae bacterium]|jgi:ATP-dependent DNA helicase RecQ|nr:ATP-dependent DNA helicase [Atopobiaceae bacterium]
MSAATIDDARAALLGHFGYHDFRPGQSEVVSAILAGRDALAVMPTGAGKSACYQVPAAVLGGLTLVISPLIALMGDQVRALKEAGIRGSYLNSTLNARQQSIVMQRALDGWYDIMYVAPERLGDYRFRQFISQAKVPLLAIDEAHCVSQWGQDFRPAYRDIADFVGSLPARPVVAALTATATERVRDDITDLLGLSDPLVEVSGFDRPNLFLGTAELSRREKDAWLAGYVRHHDDASGIVYIESRKGVERVASDLADRGVDVVRYHAGLSIEERSSARMRFVADDVRVMVATTAFGMGIDKPNVRWVVNMGLPLSLEEYYQQAGRAGRDGGPAECWLLWNRGDLRTCRFLIDHAEPAEGVTADEARAALRNRGHLLDGMLAYAEDEDCLRRHILAYFGEDLDDVPETCDNCSCCTDTETGVLERTDVRRRPTARKVDRTRVAAAAAETPEASETFDRLRALRKRLASEAGVPPYVVFSDATLHAMAAAAPTTADELLQVSGVGPIKLERYGDAFLAELAR